MQKYSHTSMAIVLLAAGWICAAGVTTNALAESGSVSAGIPTVVGNDGDGHPMIEYRGAGSGSAGAGVPVIVGNDGDGHPVIEYHGAGSGSLSSGLPTITGTDGEGHPRIAYLSANPGGTDRDARRPSN